VGLLIDGIDLDTAQKLVFFGKEGNMIGTVCEQSRLRRPLREASEACFGGHVPSGCVVCQRRATGKARRLATVACVSGTGAGCHRINVSARDHHGFHVAHVRFFT
jgi:hypothetical protein